MVGLSVNTNPSSFVALETLNDTDSDLSHTENTISTGKKVATAADNPASFGIYEEIGGQVAGQNAVNDGLSYAASLVNITTSASNKIIGVLKNIRGTVTSAGDYVGEGGALSDINKQITGYCNEMDTIARSVTSNGVNLLVGASDPEAFDVTSRSLSYVTSFEGNTRHITNALSIIKNLHIIGDATKRNYHSPGTYNEPLSFPDRDSTAYKETQLSGETIGSDAKENPNYLPYDDYFTAQGVNSKVDDIKGREGPDCNNDMRNLVHEPDGSWDGNDTLSLHDLERIHTISQALGIKSGSDSFESYSKSNNFLTGILLGKQCSPTGHITSVVPGSALTNQNAMNDAIGVVDNAIKAMQYITARLGTNKQQIQKLSSFGLKFDDNLQDAQGSLTDADISKESARLSSIQTKQQLSIKSLTIANGQSQNILSLFQG